MFPQLFYTSIAPNLKEPLSKCSHTNPAQGFFSLSLMLHFTGVGVVPDSLIPKGLRHFRNIESALLCSHHPRISAGRDPTFCTPSTIPVLTPTTTSRFMGVTTTFLGNTSQSSNPLSKRFGSSNMWGKQRTSQARIGSWPLSGAMKLL